MAKAVRLSDIGERLDVSAVTVSKALSGQKGVSEEMRQKLSRLLTNLDILRKQKRKTGGEVIILV